MLSVLFLVACSVVMVLSLMFPAQIGLFLTLSVLLVSVIYVLHVCVPLLFFDAVWIIDPRIVFLPVPVLIAAAVFIPYRTAFLWIIYVLTMIFGCIVPLLRYLSIRIRLYTYVRKTGQYRFSAFLLGGRHTPLDIAVETPEGKRTVSILGTAGSSRFFILEKETVSQRVSTLLCDVLADAEKASDHPLLQGTMKLLLGEKYTFPRTPAADSDEAYLFVHPGCIVWKEDTEAVMGERIAGYNIVSLKMTLDILKKNSRSL